MKREPIIQPQYEVVLSKEQPKLKDLLPRYRYEFQGVSLSDESKSMYDSLIDFLETNESLAVDRDCSDDYIQGFQKSLSLVRLWLDSLYLPQNQ